MKMVFLAAGVTAALNWSIVTGSLDALRGISEPVGLVIWGVALFAAAAAVKRTPQIVTGAMNGKSQYVRGSKHQNPGSGTPNVMPSPS